jgi:hypothetical protein
MEINTKYPRTYHLPFSPGTSSDDRKLTQEQFEEWFLNTLLVVSEKMDGEGVMFSNSDVYSRSHAAPTRHPWSRNLWDKDGLLWKVKDKIGEDEYVYGENLYGEHSIHYDHLTSYFYMFAARDNDNWYSWRDVELMAEILNVPTVPVLFEGTINTEKELRELIDDIMSKPSTFGTKKEGVVIRHVEAFPVEVDGESIFHKNVCKWVRPHHVQTDSHWTKYWKKAEIKRY